MTNGVFPEPPIERFPTLTTGYFRRCALKIRRSYKEFLNSLTAPYTVARGFIAPPTLEPPSARRRPERTTLQACAQCYPGWLAAQRARYVLIARARPDL